MRLKHPLTLPASRVPSLSPLGRGSSGAATAAARGRLLLRARLRQRHYFGEVGVGRGLVRDRHRLDEMLLEARLADSGEENGGGDNGAAPPGEG